MNATEYLLSCLIEECAEVIQRATKAQRFGVNEVQPGQDQNNIDRLSDELADLEGTIQLLQDEGVNLCRLPDAVEAKKKKVREFMEYSRAQGTLTG